MPRGVSERSRITGPAQGLVLLVAVALGCGPEGEGDGGGPMPAPQSQAGADCYPDEDGDGYGSNRGTWFDEACPSGTSLIREDCDDANPEVHPGAEDVWYDGVDSDCDGRDDYDADGDGSRAQGTAAHGLDCDDTDPNVNPWRPEVCEPEGVDDDCDRLVDEADPSLSGATWYLDNDGDGYGDPETAIVTCDDVSGMVVPGGDCDDDDHSIHPGALEVWYDGVDSDCDGQDDDADGDRYGNDAYGGTDCDDTDPHIHPAAAEICDDGVDNNCDGLVDPEIPSGPTLVSCIEPLAQLSYRDCPAYDNIDGAGDVDGDGLADVIIGDHCSSERLWEGGAAHIVRGASWSPGEAAVAYASFYGASGSEYAGVSVAGIGDSNGDGYDDVLIGAMLADDGGLSSGAVYLVEGPGETTSLRWADATIRGESSMDEAGREVARVGDVDGDGLADALIAAPFSSDSEERAGAVYLVTAPFESSGLSTAEAKLTGWEEHMYAGSALASAGDLDGDGLTDVVIGAPFYDVGDRSDMGVAIVAFGPLASMSMSDAGLQLVGETAGSNAGSDVAGPGDTDGDGYDDLLIGAEGWRSLRGAAYVVLGDADLSELGVVSLVDADAGLHGRSVYDTAGYSVSGAGDLDGDGLADIAVGALYADPASDAEGKAYILLGPIESTRLEAADVVLMGQTWGERLGSALANVGDVDGDGFDDLAIGAPYTSDGVVSYLLRGGF